MKKFALITVAFLIAALTTSGAEYKWSQHTATSATNTVTITGNLKAGLKPLLIAQDITGTETNTVTITYNPATVLAASAGDADDSTVFRCNPLTAVVGGSEKPEDVSGGVKAPNVLKSGDVMYLVGSGTASNVVYNILWEVVE
jgi:hypothetical protein